VVTRTREAGRRDAARPARAALGGAAAAGRTMVRSPAAPSPFRFSELLLADFRFGATDVGFAGSGRRRWCRRRASAARYGVIDNDRQILQH
jgi:hypothetical protein